jgi:hypothetical protein
MSTIISQKLEATNLETHTTECLSFDGCLHEPDQWSRPFCDEEARHGKRADLQKSGVKRMADGGFKVLVAA